MIQVFRMGFVKFVAVGAMVMSISSCRTSIPQKANAVTDFDITQYAGTWYEMARMPMRFEKNLNRVTATYSLNDNGTVNVVNKGYNYKKNKWETAEGTAKFVGDKNVARLKVSFFGPFYGGYNVVKLDENYQYALVAGDDLNYLWILSKTKTLPDSIRKAYLAEAKRIGYDLEKLEWILQE